MSRRDAVAGEPRGQLDSDTAFAVIPEWVLFADVSAQAVRLYGALRRFADKDGRCWPSRATLAEKLRASTSTVDRGLAELVEIGALTVTHRVRPGTKEYTSSIYTLHVLPRNRSVRCPAGDDTSTATDAVLTTGDEGAPHMTTPAPLVETGAPPVTKRTRATEREPLNETPPTPQRGERWLEEFAEWYRPYPRKTARTDAEKAWVQVRRAGATFEQLVGGLVWWNAYWTGRGTPIDKVPYPASWLRQGHWRDLPLDPPDAPGASAVTPSWRAALTRAESWVAGGVMDVDEATAWLTDNAPEALPHWGPSRSESSPPVPVEPSGAQRPARPRVSCALCGYAGPSLDEHRAQHNRYLRETGLDTALSNN